MQTFAANLNRAIRDREAVTLGGGTFTPEELEKISARLDTFADMLEALYIALPFIEDHEGSDIYKAGAVTKAGNIVRAAIKRAEAIE